MADATAAAIRVAEAAGDVKGLAELLLKHARDEGQLLALEKIVPSLPATSVAGSVNLVAPAASVALGNGRGARENSPHPRPADAYAFGRGARRVRAAARGP
jgi:ATP/maltotriose-dependent transcriptional regulator MalT